MEAKLNISEKEYVSALKMGDISAFDKLFADYGKRLYHFAYGYLKSKEEAEEVVQEVFLRVWKNKKALKTELSFKAYLFKIAYHFILELFEKAQNKTGPLHDIIESSVSFDNNLDEKLDYQMLLTKVEKLIDSLPARQKEVLVLRKIDGVPVKDIASQLNISHKTVENHLTQALKNIKKGLGEDSLSSLLFFLLFVKG